MTNKTLSSWNKKTTFLLKKTVQLGFIMMLIREREREPNINLNSDGVWCMVWIIYIRCVVEKVKLKWSACCWALFKFFCTTSYCIYEVKWKVWSEIKLPGLLCLLFLLNWTLLRISLYIHCTSEKWSELDSFK